MAEDGAEAAEAPPEPADPAADSAADPATTGSDSPAKRPSGGRSGRGRSDKMALLKGLERSMPASVAERVRLEDLADGLRDHDESEFRALAGRLLAGEDGAVEELDAAVAKAEAEEDDELVAILAAKARNIRERRDEARDLRTDEMLAKWDELDKRRVVRPIPIDRIGANRILARRIAELRNRDDRRRVTREWRGSADQPFARALYPQIEEDRKHARLVNERPIAQAAVVGAVFGGVIGWAAGGIATGALIGLGLGLIVGRFMPLPHNVSEAHRTVSKVDPQAIVDHDLGLQPAQLRELKAELARYERLIAETGSAAAAVRQERDAGGPSRRLGA